MTGARRSLFLAAAALGPAPAGARAFPWTLPIVRALDGLQFTAPVTFFVGENGSGKSTVLEALALASDAVALGGHDLAADPTLAGARALAANLVLSRRGRPRAKAFLRAEDVFGYTQRLASEMRSLAETSSGLAGTRAEPYVAAQRASLAGRYGDDPDARSHGETFLDLLSTRLVPAGLYFLDEPETPLSPIRVLALLRLIGDAARAGSQFVIATHSPLLMALPGAALLSFENGAIRAVAYDDVDHVRVTRDFLAAPQRYLRHVFGPLDRPQ